MSARFSGEVDVHAFLDSVMRSLRSPCDQWLRLQKVKMIGSPKATKVGEGAILTLVIARAS